MRKLCWVFLFLFLSSVSYGQFDVSSYLSRTVNDVEMQSIQAQQDFAANNSFKPSIFREFEIRFRARGLDEGFDDYRFRVGFLNPYERRANKHYATALQQQLATQKRVDYNVVLASRYRSLIEHLAVRQKITLNTSSIQVYQQLFQANRGRVEEAKELIEIDRKLFVLELKKQDLYADLAVVESRMKEYYQFEGSIATDAIKWITVATMESILQRYQDIDIEQNIHVQNEENKKVVSERNYEISKQETFSNIGYVQAEYRPYRGDSFDETFGVQVGVELPLVKQDKGDLQRRELNLIEDQNDAKILRSKLITEQNQLFAHVSYLIEKHKMVEGKLASISSANLTSSGGKLPTLMAYTDYVQDLTELQNEIYANLLYAYIDWLQITGVLTSEPINYLSDNLSSFGQS